MRIDKTLGKSTVSLNPDQSRQTVQAVVETAPEVRHRPVIIGRRRQIQSSPDKDRRGHAGDRRRRKQRSVDQPVLLDTRSRHDRRQQLRRATLSNTEAQNLRQAGSTKDAVTQTARGIDTTA